MLKKICLLCTLFLVIPLTTSCFDAHEVDNYAYVTTLGIDKGITDKWRFSFQVTNMRKTGNSQSSVSMEEPEHVLLTIEALDFFHAIDAMDSTLARTLNFRHTKYIVISNDVAQEGSFSDVIAPLIRFAQLRRTAGVLVSTCSAESFIEEFNPKLGVSMARLQEGFLEQSKDTGFFPEVRFNDYYSAVKSRYIQPIAILVGKNDFTNIPPLGEEAEEVEKKVIGKRYAGELPRKGGNTIEFFGTALFDGDRMVGKLNGYETRIMLMIRGEYNNGNFTHNDPLKPDLQVSLYLTQRNKPKIKVNMEKGKPIINIKIMLNGYINSIQSRINYESMGMIGYIESMVEDTIRQEAEDLIDKAKELNVDFLNFGSYIVRQFLTIQEWEKYEWMEKVKDVSATVDVDVKIRRTGTMISNSPNITQEGEE